MAESKAAQEQRIPGQLPFFDPTYMAMIGDFYAQWFHGAMKVSQELTEMAQTRLKDEMAAWAKIANCRDPREFVEYQRNRAQEVTAQAAQDVAKVSRMIASMVQSSAMKEAA